MGNGVYHSLGNEHRKLSTDWHWSAGWWLGTAVLVCMHCVCVCACVYVGEGSCVEWVNI